MPRTKSTSTKRSLSLTHTSWVFSKPPPLPEALSQENVIQTRMADSVSHSALETLSLLQVSVDKGTGRPETTENTLYAENLSESPTSYNTFFGSNENDDQGEDGQQPAQAEDITPSVPVACNTSLSVKYTSTFSSSTSLTSDVSGVHTPSFCGSFEQPTPIESEYSLNMASLNLANQKLSQAKRMHRTSAPTIQLQFGDDWNTDNDSHTFTKPNSAQVEDHDTLEPGNNPTETHEKSYQIAQEILNSERTYVKGLLMIQKVFLCPLLESLATESPILPRNSITRIFSNILDIVNLNRELLKQLEEQIATSPPSQVSAKIAKIFLDISPFLKMYSMYARNFSNAITTVSTHSNQNSAFARFISVANDLPECGSLRFESHLILPVQRIPRYEMLLRQLMKSVGNEHPDYASLTKALHYVEDVAKYVNEMIRAGEQSIIMIQIQKSLTGLSENLFVPGRTFIHRGSAKKICRKSHQLRKFFLFTDILIYASPSIVGGSYSFKRKLSLRELHISDIPDEEGEPNNRFKISSREKSFVLYVEHPKQKEEWINLVQSAIQNLQGSIVPDGNINPSNIPAEFKEHLKETIFRQQVTEPAIVKDYYSPVWVPDSEASNCACCNEPFNPVTRRRHHCRLCGKVICHGCSSKRFVIPGKYGDDYRIERICDPCYNVKFDDQTQQDFSAAPPAQRVKNKRIKELAIPDKNAENRRHSFISEFSRVINPDGKGGIIDSIRSQRTRAMTMIESGLRASFHGGSTPILNLSFMLKKKCDLCLEEFSIFRWRNDCSKCKRTICFDCLSKQAGCKFKTFNHEQEKVDDFVKMNPGMFEGYFDETSKLCDPCSRGIPRSQVQVDENGGGWSIVTTKPSEAGRRSSESDDTG
ncbi:hypothetical protein K493DRAFT_95172 [Basidiobolus meristosporus CBS 931.73]|uniref:Dbl homology domain-containing protein n=1 Tax=Basidiobolus meristosporus CBS 931.73 TaxID=1314790 RepID=A0A1Y1X677_9FUNG|nr:hypothetical protein K493DRAFT_95172 [Basidiobolus meristosporus CBS 931.73]|eukprot:ORX81311.1 hypothetical protein K493DRAFT_95172 [Basidiobolus meristosporus CBS 931.73]